jgi:hypothetical protein
MVGAGQTNRAAFRPAPRPAGAPGRGRGVLVALLGLVALWVWGTAGCGPPPSNASAAPTEEQRLLPVIVRTQQERVGKLAAEAAKLGDELTSLRLRQRILEQYGRPDLAAALEPEAEQQAERLVKLRTRLADAEEALRAYQDYAARAEEIASRGRRAEAPEH